MNPGVAEWPIAIDCKSIGLCLRGFESLPLDTFLPFLEYNSRMKSSNLTSIQKKYKGLWVALKEDLSTVIVADKNANIVYKKALAKGLKKPTLFKVPENIVPYVGTSHVAQSF